jgi:hypothetical protein
MKSHRPAPAPLNTPRRCATAGAAPAPATPHTRTDSHNVDTGLSTARTTPCPFSTHHPVQVHHCLLHVLKPHTRTQPPHNRPGVPTAQSSLPSPPRLTAWVGAGGGDDRPTPTTSFVASPPHQQPLTIPCRCATACCMCSRRTRARSHLTTRLHHVWRHRRTSTHSPSRAGAPQPAASAPAAPPRPVAPTTKRRCSSAARSAARTSSR